MKRYIPPQVIGTDRLRPYGVATKVMGLAVRQACDRIR